MSCNRAIPGYHDAVICVASMLGVPLDAARRYLDDSIAAIQGTVTRIESDARNGALHVRYERE